MRIGELAKQSGLNASRIRFYEARGLLHAVVRGENGYRSYPPEALQVLRIITGAQRAGFSLEEIRKLIGKVEQRGYTLIPLDLHYKGGRIKLEVGLAKGKQHHDKRATERDKQWQRDKQRLIRNR